MYPLHLENQYEKFFEKQFKSIADRVRREVTAALKTTVRDGAVRADSPVEVLLGLIEKLKADQGNWIDQEKLEEQITRNFHLLDAWSRDKLAESLERLNTPQPPSVTGRPTPAGQTGELWLTTVNLMSGTTGMTEAIRDRMIRTNLNLIRSLGSEHIDGVADILANGFTQGRGLKEITDDIEHLTGVHRSKARFWARDQASKFFGEVTRERQISAGIPGYIWRTLKDGRVRDNHGAMSGRYVDWKKPPSAGTRGRKVHPGEDYNCRCWAEPAFGPEYEDKEPAPEDPMKYMEQTWPKKEVLRGYAMAPTITQDNRHKALTMFSEYSKLSPDDIREKITKAQECDIWEKKSYTKHLKRKDSAHNFDKYAEDHMTIARYTIKNPQRIFAGYMFKAKRLAFYSSRYDAFVIIDEKTNMIRTMFHPMKSFMSEFVEIL